VVIVISFYQTLLAPAINSLLGSFAGRTNILLLGSDTDGKGNDTENGVPLAQTIMIITVDPHSNSVGMLSIPRDMQVLERGYTEPKLDEVFSHGYTGNTWQEKVAHGAAEMKDVIQYNFGIHIDHYAWVGLDGFVKVIDTAGGIDVDVLHPMVDDTYPDDTGNTNGSVYDYKRISLAPGPQHLNGAQALEYVRTRHSDLVGDFGRTVRQQQVISQLKSKLATSDTIGKASELLQDLNGSSQTDMSLSDIISLGNLARNIDSNKVDHLTLGPPDYAVLNTDGNRPGNYLPICNKIVPAIEKMFNMSYAVCLSQATSNTGSTAPTTPSVSVPATSNTTVASESKQVSPLGGIAKNALTLNTEGNFPSAVVRDLLDVLFTITIESFDALQI
jgi:LCP family protein required for cell wall assembly